MLLVLECIKVLEKKGGAMQVDMINMCELNQRYLMNITHILLEKGLVYSTDSKPYHYYRTPLGKNTHKRLAIVMKQTGFVPKLNASKNRIYPITKPYPPKQIS